MRHVPSNFSQVRDLVRMPSDELKLPKDYSVRNIEGVKFIVRKTADDQSFTPLTIDSNMRVHADYPSKLSMRVSKLPAKSAPQLGPQINRLRTEVSTLQYGGLAVTAILVQKRRELGNLMQARTMLQNLQASLPPAAIEESKARLLTSLPDLWYARNPDQTALYRKVKP